MGKVELAATQEHEWLNWDQTMRLIQATKAGPYTWQVLADWCGQGLIESKAGTIVREGEVCRDVGLDAKFWRLVDSAGIRLDPLNGSINWAHRDPNTEEPQSASIFGLRFRKDQVLELVSHVDPEELASALVAKGPWLGGKKQSAPPIEAMKVESSAGRKPDKVKWQTFWFAAIHLAQEGRLNAACFGSAAELSEELLLLMGDDAFSPDHIKPTVGQIYKKFVKDR